MQTRKHYKTPAQQPQAQQTPRAVPMALAHANKRAIPLRPLTHQHQQAGAPQCLHMQTPPTDQTSPPTPVATLTNESSYTNLSSHARLATTCTPNASLRIGGLHMQTLQQQTRHPTNTQEPQDQDSEAPSLAHPNTKTPPINQTSIPLKTHRATT